MSHHCTDNNESNVEAIEPNEDEINIDSTVGSNILTMDDTNLGARISLESKGTGYDEALKHHVAYTKLLNLYVNNAHQNFENKNKFKKNFFRIAIALWILPITIFIAAFNNTMQIISQPNADGEYIEAVASAVGLIIPSLTSVITSYIVIPKVIAEYLFNKDEENSMIEIVKNLQTYDNSLYSNLSEKTAKAEEISVKDLQSSENSDRDTQESNQDNSSNNEAETENAAEA